MVQAWFFYCKQGRIYIKKWGGIAMKIKLRDLAKAMAKSDVHQGYVDIKLGKVIIM